MKLGIITLGCRLNSLESEAIASSFKQKGWDVHNEASEDDDLIIVNTCTVTSKADQGARRIIRHFGDTIPTVVTGCYANLATKKEIEQLGSKVRLIRDKSTLLQDVNSVLYSINNGESKYSSTGNTEVSDEHKFDFNPNAFYFHSRASLKIQDGCDNSCSYCAVHLARGKSISLNPKTIQERIKILEDKGYKEICLVGVNVASYNYDGINISKLLEMLIPHLNDDTRIRFSSLEPDYIDQKFYDIAKDKHIFPFFHLPLQSASKRVLELTGRKYDKIALKNIIENLRKSKDNPYIAADIIAGLPGEGEEEAKETYDFINDTKLSRLHVFPYSPRYGTAAASMKRVPERIRDERAKELSELSKRLYSDYVKSNKGKILEAITEKTDATGTYITTSNYIKAKIRNTFLDEGLLIRGTLSINDDCTMPHFNVE